MYSLVTSTARSSSSNKFKLRSIENDLRIKFNNEKYYGKNCNAYFAWTGDFTYFFYPSKEFLNFEDLEEYTKDIQTDYINNHTTGTISSIYTTQTTLVEQGINNYYLRSRPEFIPHHKTSSRTRTLTPKPNYDEYLKEDKYDIVIISPESYEELIDCLIKLNAHLDCYKRIKTITILIDCQYLIEGDLIAKKFIKSLNSKIDYNVCGFICIVDTRYISKDRYIRGYDDLSVNVSKIGTNNSTSVMIPCDNNTDNKKKYGFWFNEMESHKGISSINRYNIYIGESNHKDNQNQNQNSDVDYFETTAIANMTTNIELKKLKDTNIVLNNEQFNINVMVTSIKNVLDIYHLNTTKKGKDLNLSDILEFYSINLNDDDSIAFEQMGDSSINTTVVNENENLIVDDGIISQELYNLIEKKGVDFEIVKRIIKEVCPKFVKKMKNNEGTEMTDPPYFKSSLVYYNEINGIKYTKEYEMLLRSICKSSWKKQYLNYLLMEYQEVTKVLKTILEPVKLDEPEPVLEKSVESENGETSNEQSENIADSKEVFDEKSEYEEQDLLRFQIYGGLLIPRRNLGDINGVMKAIRLKLEPRLMSPWHTPRIEENDEHPPVLNALNWREMDPVHGRDFPLSRQLEEPLKEEGNPYKFLHR